MKVGIIGSGGREHALCQSLKNSKKIDEIFCFPGNAGTALIAKNITINLENFEILKNFIINKNIDLIVVGPEKPLVDGMADYLRKFKIKVFGPNKIASQLEGSKIFTKKLCKKFNIPTAKFGIFDDKNEAGKFLKSANFPLVVKADNLASGKGVYICNNFDEANIAVEEIFNGKFGKAENLLIEEFLIGEEMSFFTIHDGKNFKTFGTAQDHKRVLEGDKGKNTGGMGAYSPSRLINPELEEKIINKIIKPTLKGLLNIGCDYKGFLYTGLMIVKNETNFLVKIGGIKIFSIKGNSEEIYKNEKLISFKSSTLQNKKRKFVKLIFDENKNLFIIDGSSFKGETSPDNVIGNWWNSKILQSKSQISPLSGSVKEQIVKLVGKDEMILNGKKYKLFKFNLKSSNEELPKDKKLDFNIW